MSTPRATRRAVEHGGVPTPPDSTKAVLERWSAAGMDMVLLPSGTLVRIRVPEVTALVLGNVLPRELRSIALQYEGGAGGNVLRNAEGQLDIDRVEQAYAMWRHMAAYAIRQVNVDGEWVPIRLTAEQWEAEGLPPRDRAAIESICMGRSTPAQITAQSQAELGQITEAEAERVTEEEAAGTVNAFAGFHSDTGGAGAGADSPTIRAAAKRSARGQGPAAGAGAG